MYKPWYINVSIRNTLKALKGHGLELTITDGPTIIARIVMYSNRYHVTRLLYLYVDPQKRLLLYVRSLVFRSVGFKCFSVINFVLFFFT